MQSSALILSFGIVGLVLLSSPEAKANVIVSAGYYDVPPCCGNANPFPSPWYGAPNTTYFGDVANVTGSDPDEAAVLIQNKGSAAVTLSAARVGPYTFWDSFIGAGYTIGAGKNVILSATIGDNFDGSDIGLGGSVVTLTINGASHSFADTHDVLSGWPGGSADETLPWSEIGSVSSGVPELSTWGMMLVGLAGLGLVSYRRGKSSGVASPASA